MRKAARDLLVAGLLIAASPAVADPLPLGDDAAIEKLSQLIVANAGVERLHWVVAADDTKVQTRLLKTLAVKLGVDHGDLIERVRGEGPAASTRAIGGTASGTTGGSPVAYVEVAPALRTTCSWNVAVSDPALPSPNAKPTPIPLQKGETMTVSQKASFEISTSGPLQSTLYAFGETGSGSIRDLAAVPEYAIPAADQGETLVLVRARKPIPYLDTIKNQLAANPGDRADLGADYALVSRFAGGTRGIGALIQLVDPNMVVAENTTPPPTRPKPEEPAPDLTASADLQETCLFTLKPALSM
ncbi:hypothetical protein [Oryzibacter oryziterrae]|uniref:hypothetical protein n=1 Tax=Oryzibacter oryziterrae TaxID=2766474 RepID=UPI001F3CE062|nr:hypothetical protein [Oryzibacter oryziterrae]